MAVDPVRDYKDESRSKRLSSRGRITPINKERSKEIPEEVEKALRLYAEALVNLAMDIHRERKTLDDLIDPESTKMLSVKRMGPHRSNGRPRDPNPNKEGQDMSSITGDPGEGLS